MASENLKLILDYAKSCNGYAVFLVIVVAIHAIQRVVVAIIKWITILIRGYKK